LTITHKLHEIKTNTMLNDTMILQCLFATFGTVSIVLSWRIRFFTPLLAGICTQRCSI